MIHVGKEEFHAIVVGQDEYEEVAGRLLVLGGAQLFDRDQVVDDDRVRRVEERVQPLRNLGKLHPLALEDLPQKRVAVDKLPLVGVLANRKQEKKTGIEL